MRAAPRVLSPNERRVVDLLLEHGPASRVELADRVGMSRPSLNDLVARLVGAGLLELVGEVSTGRRGPNAVHFRVRAELALAAGVELQPERVRVVVADLGGRVLADETRETHDDDAGSGVVAAVRAALTTAEVSPDVLGRVVVGMPGVIDADGAVRYVSGHPDWRPPPVTALERSLGCPVLVENDVNLLALVEGIRGHARDCERYTLLQLDRGVRAATIAGGVPVRGARGFAGEIGLAAALVPDGERSTRLQDLLGSTALDRLRREAGDAAVVDRIARVAGLLGAVLDPECVVLGGAVGTHGGPALAERVQRRVAELMPLHLEIRATGLAGDAVADGAVAIATARLREDLLQGAL